MYFGVFGDLSFFYDLNSLGNRHIGNNVRIMLINNSLGAEFHLFRQRNSIFVNGVEKYISAGGHFGQQSPTLVRDFVQSLGFTYLSASGKEEFLKKSEQFVQAEKKDKSIVFEVFVDVAADNEALYKMWQIDTSSVNKVKTKVKEFVKGEDINNLQRKYKISLENIENRKK